MPDIYILSDSPGNVVQLMLTDSNRDTGERRPRPGPGQRRFCYRTPDKNRKECAKDYEKGPEVEVKHIFNNSAMREKATETPVVQMGVTVGLRTRHLNSLNSQWQEDAMEAGQYMNLLI